MAVPRNRVSNMRKNTRRSHMARKPRNLITCPQCGAKALPHCLCEACGHYDRKLVVSTESR